MEPIKIGSDGFVRLVDIMGDESSIVQAARVSYQKGTKTYADDRSLIRYLMRHRHTTPFEMVELKFHVRVPMDCWRQWIRHRTASVNEYSTRYSEAIDSMASTDYDAWRLQSTTNKQGSGDFLPREKGEFFSLQEMDFHQHAKDVYEGRIKAGIAREQARKDLPLSTYTEAYWKIDLHNLFHFLGLRMDSHAQLEIRQYANAIGEILKEKLPVAWEAFVDYRLLAMQLSDLDVQAMRKIFGLVLSYLALDEGIVDSYISDVFSNSREESEFREKLRRLLSV